MQKNNFLLLLMCLSSLQKLYTSELQKPVCWTTDELLAADGELSDSKPRHFIRATFPKGEAGIKVLNAILRNKISYFYDRGFPAPQVVPICIISETDKTITLSGEVTTKEHTQAFLDVLTALEADQQEDLSGTLLKKITTLGNNNKADPIEPRWYFRATLSQDESEEDLKQKIREAKSRARVNTEESQTTLEKFLLLIHGPQMTRTKEGNILISADITHQSGTCSESNLCEAFRKFKHGS